jgi:hypothetical protein
MGAMQGVLCHHTCGPLQDDLPDVNVLCRRPSGSRRSASATSDWAVPARST